MDEEEMAVDPDADDARVGATRLPRRPGLRRRLRRAGFVFQVLLCSALAVWSTTAGEVSFTVIAAVLLAVAVLLLVRDVRDRPPTGGSDLAPGADLGEGAADDDPHDAEGRQ